MHELVPNHLSRCLTIVSALLFVLLTTVATGFADDWIYTVQPGDDLWSLSKKYLISIRYREKLQQLNKVTDPLHIRPGTRLRFPLKWLKSGSSVARISHVHGRVEVLAGETQKIRPALPGMLLWEKDTVRTGADSNVTLEFGDGSKIILLGDSKLLLELMKSYGETGMQNTRIRLLRGRTRNKVIPGKGPGSHFEIITPSAAAAVRGTEYRISADKNNESKAEVLRGAVGMDSRGEERDLPAGFGSVAFADRAPLQPVALLPAPDISELPATITHIPFSVRVKPDGRALAYRLQIAADSHFQTLLFNSILPMDEVTVSELPDGSYFLRLRGIDNHGLEGFESVRPFVLAARPQPPRGIRPAAGTVIKKSPPTFTWSESPGTGEYVFQVADNKAFTEPLINLARHPETSYTPKQTLPPGKYYWRLAVRGPSGKQGPFSEPLSFRCPPPVPDLPLARFDEQESLFSWKNTGPGRRYRVQISLDPSFTDTIRDEQVNEPRYSLAQLDPGSYYIRIATIDSDGFLGSFSQSRQVDVTAPFNPWVLSLVPLAALFIFP